MTSTMAHLVKTEQSQLSTEVPNINPDFHIPYNGRAREPPTPHWPPGWNNLQLSDQNMEEDMEENETSDDEDIMLAEEAESSSDESTDSDTTDSDDDNNIQVGQQWRVIPDVAELDDHVVTRERDIVEAGDGINEKFSGWHNPLADTDNGNDDDTVVVQIGAQGIREHHIRENNLLQYAESEGPTKVDYGEDESQVVYRENDIVEAGAGVNKKFSGWHNPLADTDDGDNDESVL